MGLSFARFRGSRRFGGSGRGCARDFANLEAGKTADGNIFAELGNGLGDHLTDSLSLVLDEVLFVQAALFVELFHLTGDDLLNDGLGLAGGACLSAIDLALALEHFRGYVFAANVARINGSDVHGHVVAKLFEGLGAGNEIALAVNFDDNADFAAGMNIMADQAFGGFARSFLGGGSLTLLAQNVDGLFDVAVGFDERGAAIAETGVGASLSTLSQAWLEFP